MTNSAVKQYIESGKAVLGIEFGSTRIKAVLCGDDFSPLAQGSFNWKNHLENGLWTYHAEEIINGLQSCYAKLCENVQDKYEAKITKLGSLGISAMMHGLLAFDSEGKLLTPFRTWRNTNTTQAAEILSDKLNFNIPLRWGVSHLFQAILDKEKWLENVKSVTTLAGYVHRLLTGENVLGIGDASGMFPCNEVGYDSDKLDIFNNLCKDYGYDISAQELLPKVLVCGENAGRLTKSGAILLDRSGLLCESIPMCAPEGDAGTGMTATNSVKVGTGNVSAGTSVFAMEVLDKPLKNRYTEIDVVTTPDGKPVAMVHCNNCCSDIDAWVKLFGEAASLLGANFNTDKLYELLFNEALCGEPDCSEVVAINTVSGEPVLKLESGKPMLIRNPNSDFTLKNFMRASIYSTACALKTGMIILTDKENVQLDKITGHGGLFKTKGAAQKLMASALEVPVSVMSTAGEGGAWGMALLAAYMLDRETNTSESLSDFLEKKVFVNTKCETCFPNQTDSEGFEKYRAKYLNYLAAEKAVQIPQI